MTQAPASLAGPDRLDAALARSTGALLSAMAPEGHWVGELSSSALSTAVATIALGTLDRAANRQIHADLVHAGLRWLAGHVNADGGWGDTVRSRSNLSTTALVWAAFGAASADDRYPDTMRRAQAWLDQNKGPHGRLASAIEAAYGSDRTFSVPILMTMALSGRLGPEGWRQVPGLPFELAAFPRSWFGALQLPVVSYALPALIAIGQVIHHHAPSRNPLARFLRWMTAAPTQRTLETLQPPNGGFLEATPLTAFVTMSLASLGLGDGLVATKGASFLRASARPDGSWPIDTNLATWLTTLSIKALSHQPGALTPSQQHTLRDWLLAQQGRSVHPYTGAAPGGWAWTPLPGGVPDADDTAGALLALNHLGAADEATLRAAEAGVVWLLDLQNRDGGMPTFCRGWGTLPFDRSTPEITAHAIRAWTAWRARLAAPLVRRMDAALGRALAFLAANQGSNGSWIPLWFGNERAAGQENPVYGTAQVLTALHGSARGGIHVDPTMLRKAAGFLARAQAQDGGWGGDAGAPPSLEETALAVEALSDSPEHAATLARGAARLVQWVEEAGCPEAAPIGLYFARLWYFERLYPLIFATGGLAACRPWAHRSPGG